MPDLNGYPGLFQSNKINVRQRCRDRQDLWSKAITLVPGRERVRLADGHIGERINTK